MAAGKAKKGKRWSQSITETSNPMDLEEGVFHV